MFVLDGLSRDLLTSLRQPHFLDALRGTGAPLKTGADFCADLWRALFAAMLGRLTLLTRDSTTEPLDCLCRVATSKESFDRDAVVTFTNLVAGTYYLRVTCNGYNDMLDSEVVA